jgi:fumarate reductase flavoprotein subunit
MKPKASVVLILFCLSLFTGVAAAENKTYDVDMVIVGGGLAGLVAANEAIENNLNVLVLEKMPATGGHAVYFAGTLGINSRIDYANSVFYTVDEVFKTTMEYIHWQGNARIIRKAYEMSAQDIDWLAAHGTKFASTNPRTEYRDAMHTLHVFEGANGLTVVGGLAESYKKHGGKILLETPGKELIVKDGKVVGVMAENADGDKITVNAKAVLLATGGYADNKEWLRKYAGTDDVQFFFDNPKNRTGDGIRMAQAAGALLGSMNCIGMNVWFDFSFPLINTYVDQQGKRFVDEEHAIIAYPALAKNVGHAYHIIDQNDVEMVMNKGINFPRFYDKSFSPEFNRDWIPWFNPEKQDFPQNPPSKPDNLGLTDTRDPSFQARLDKAVAEGRVVKADTVEELAAKINVPADALKETVKQVNAEYAAGYDREMLKMPAFLRTLNKPPFYATKFSRLAAWGTMGGVVTDEYARALNTNHEIIPGLYMGGLEIGGLYGDTYPYVAEGTSSAISIAMARVAVWHVRDNLSKK